MIRTGLFRYVRYPDMAAYCARGWMFIAPIGPWSCLMWRCDCGGEA
jgi:hypothetical protein